MTTTEVERYTLEVWEGSEPPTLEEAQAHVGGYVELVYLPDGSQLLVNEEGLLQGLAVNKWATLRAGRFIVGPALLLEGDSVWT